MSDVYAHRSEMGSRCKVPSAAVVDHVGGHRHHQLATRTMEPNPYTGDTNTHRVGNHRLAHQLDRYPLDHHQRPGRHLGRAALERTSLERQHLDLNQAGVW